ncbi:MAG TPA: ATP-binding protein [Anaeromyxobacteraceae bacterium]|nr:ATP-binding protein [Anaeromyxobacteraceae bacterium]
MCVVKPLIPRAVHGGDEPAAPGGSAPGGRLEQRLEHLLAATGDAVLLLSSSGEILDVSAQAVSLYGLARADLVGKSILALRRPDTREEGSQQLRRCLEDGEIVFETVHLTAGGRELPVRVSARRIDDGGRALVQSIIHPLSAREAAEEELGETGRLAALGAVSAGLAHEIASPLASLGTNVGLLLDAIEALPPGLADLDEARAAARDALAGAVHLQEIAAAVRGMVQGHHPSPRAVDVRAEIERAVRLTRHQVAARARLELAIAPALPLVEGYGHELGQVFLNLLVNAAQAFPAGAPPDANRVLVRATASAGEVVVEVRDTGPGIPPALLPRIFEPFVTTKAEGTGLGLPISARIVARSGGAIEATNAPEGGAIFTVRLPSARTIR